MNVDSVNNLPSWHFFGVREIKKEGKGGRKREKEKNQQYFG